MEAIYQSFCRDAVGNPSVRKRVAHLACLVRVVIWWACVLLRCVSFLIKQREGEGEERDCGRHLK